MFGCCSGLVQDCLLSLTDPDKDSLILPGVSVSDVSSFLNCLYSFKSSPSQSQVDSVIKVLLALGVDIAPYIDIKGEKVTAFSFLPKVKTTETSKTRDLFNNKEVIVVPASLDVIQLDQERGASKEKSRV